MGSGQASNNQGAGFREAVQWAAARTQQSPVLLRSPKVGCRPVHGELAGLVSQAVQPWRHRRCWRKAAATERPASTPPGCWSGSLARTAGTPAVRRPAVSDLPSTSVSSAARRWRRSAAAFSPATHRGPGSQSCSRRDEISAVEVSDRGTVGLGGPIRNDLAVDPGVDTDFIDLVFDIGAPGMPTWAAGAYGFGKTISYVSSSVGAVLIWSRCEGSSGLEHRLIGSAIGDGFNMGGLRFTGRHWWGNTIASEGRVEPAVGDLAGRTRRDGICESV